MAIAFQKTLFIKSAMQLSQLPEDKGKEIAFAGRSNAGKSSALNHITGVRNIARTSKTPGRTQCINIFEVSPGKRLIDLPGYGYAKVPLKIKQAWEVLLNQYFQSRVCLQGFCLVTDIRHALAPRDQEMIQWAVNSQLPVHILLTKADKLSRGKAIQIQHSIEKILTEFEYADISCQIFSSVSAEGLETARKKISHWFQ